MDFDQLNVSELGTNKKTDYADIGNKSSVSHLSFFLVSHVVCYWLLYRAFSSKFAVLLVT